jgi:pimeloyl-ACP methyl ester carboxylesterase
MGHEPFLVLADYLTRRGIAVLRADDRGIGGSTGDFGKATSRDFADDALAGVNFLKTRPEINPKQIGLIGHSEGGLIAPMVGADSREVAFLVLMAGPGVPGDQILKRQTSQIMKTNGAPEGAIRQTLDLQAKMFSVLKQEQDPSQAEQKMQAIVKEASRQMTAEEKSQSGFNEAAAMGQIRQFTSPWFRYFISHDPVPVLKKIKVPVLAINGEKDLQVDAGENLAAIRKALQEGGNKKAEVKALPGLNHLFQTATTGSPGEYARIAETFSPAAMQVVGDWITGLTKGQITSPVAPRRGTK